MFLLALTSGKRRSEIHAWKLDGLLCLGDWDQIQLSPSPSFIAKNQLAKEGPQSISPVVIPALNCSQDSPDTDVLLCPVRALQCYLGELRIPEGVDSYCLSPINWAILRIFSVALYRLGLKTL